MVSVLFITGALWLFIDRLKQSSAVEMWSRVSASLLMLHGAGAMVMLVVFGGLMPFHVRVGWRQNWNRTTGGLMLGANAALIVTAFGLYYAGAEVVRELVSDVHIAVGLALPALLAWHVVRGRRLRHGVELEHSPRIEERSTPRPAAPSKL